jgi:hypothetical protein
LNPNTFFIDYEVALQNAARTSFPGITIKGCCFHYTQCIWRKVQATRLVTNYKDEPEIHPLIHRAAVLTLVSQAAIEEVWYHALEVLENSDSTTSTTTFTDYFTTHWVETNRHIWNHYQTVRPRTTNNIERWHNGIKKMIKVPHPNIYHLLTYLKEEQAANEVVIIQYRARGVRPPSDGSTPN